MRQTGFSDTAWGKATHGYAKSACTLANTKFTAIVKDAQEFIKPICARNRDPTEVININDDDDDDERGDPSSFKKYLLTLPSTTCLFQILPLNLTQS
jgi:hypothetical protein